MNASENPDFQEAILLADHVINMALVELNELNQRSIKDLQSTAGFQKDTIKLLECFESSKKILGEAGKAAKCLIRKNLENIQ